MTDTPTLTEDRFRGIVKTKKPSKKEIRILSIFAA